MKKSSLLFLLVLTPLIAQEDTEKIVLPEISVEVGPGALPEWEVLAPPPQLPALPELRPEIPKLPMIDPADPVWAVQLPAATLEEWETSRLETHLTPQTWEGLLRLGYGLDFWSLGQLRLLNYGQGPIFLLEAKHRWNDRGTNTEESSNSLGFQYRTRGGTEWTILGRFEYDWEALQNRSTLGRKKVHLLRGEGEARWGLADAPGFSLGATATYRMKFFDTSEGASNSFQVTADASHQWGERDDLYGKTGLGAKLKSLASFSTWEPEFSAILEGGWKPDIWVLSFASNGTLLKDAWLGRVTAGVGVYPFPFQFEVGASLRRDREEAQGASQLAGWEEPVGSGFTAFLLLGWATEVEKDFWLRASWKYSQEIGWVVPVLRYVVSDTGLPVWDLKAFDRRLSLLSVGASIGSFSWDMGWTADLLAPANGQVEHELNLTATFQAGVFSLSANGTYTSADVLRPGLDLSLKLEPFPQFSLIGEINELLLVGSEVKRLTPEGRFVPGFGALLSVQYTW